MSVVAGSMNEDEWAILLDAMLRYREGTRKREEIASYVSALFSERAKRLGFAFRSRDTLDAHLRALEGVHSGRPETVADPYFAARTFYNEYHANDKLLFYCVLRGALLGFVSCFGFEVGADITRGTAALTNAQPLKLKCCGKTIVGLRSWPQLFTKLVEILYEDNPRGFADREYGGAGSTPGRVRLGQFDLY